MSTVYRLWLVGVMAHVRVLQTSTGLDQVVFLLELHILRALLSHVSAPQVTIGNRLLLPRGVCLVLEILTRMGFIL